MKLVSTMILIAFFLAGCAPQSDQPHPAVTRDGVAAPPTRQAVTIAFPVEPPTIEPSMGAGLGNREISAVTSAFLAILGPGEQPLPYLAQELPSTEKGSWRMLPDGQMETTYRLRPQAIGERDCPWASQAQPWSEDRYLPCLAPRHPLGLHLFK